MAYPARVSAEDLGSALTFVVEDCFRLRALGLVLAPSFEADRFRNGTRLLVAISTPSGNRASARGRFLLDHAHLQGGGSRWRGVVVLDEPIDVLEPGTEVTCVPAV